MGDDGATRKEEAHIPDVGKTTLGDFASSRDSKVQRKEDMIPRIIKPREIDLHFNKDTKWVVYAKHHGWPSYDLCRSLSDAFRMWLWHCGVSPKIAFGWFNRKLKKSNDDD